MSGCVERTSARYTKASRNSPSIPAKECVGEIKEGNDHNWWTPAQDKNGRYYWKPVDEDDLVEFEEVVVAKKKPAARKSSGAKAASAKKRASAAKKRVSAPKKRKAVATEEEPKAKCTRRTTQYYANRDMPPYEADDCPGQTRKGNNGKMYVSEYNEDLGYYKWYVAKRSSAAKRTSPAKAASTAGRIEAVAVASRAPVARRAVASTGGRIESNAGYRAPKAPVVQRGLAAQDAAMFATFMRPTAPSSVPSIAAARPSIRAAPVSAPAKIVYTKSPSEDSASTSTTYVSMPANALTAGAAKKPAKPLPQIPERVREAVREAILEASEDRS